MSTTKKLRLTSLSHGGGCGCKIDPGVLRDLLAEMPSMAAYESLLVGTETADDAAVYQINDTQAVIATTDFFMPIVDDPFDFGQIAATNALSDIYAMGGQPLMALAIVGMPVNDLPHDQIAQILAGGAHACQQAGIPIAGGHSIDSVEPIYGLAAIGLVHPEQIKKNDQAQAGDVLILTKPLGVGVLSAAFKKEQLDEQGYQAMLQSMTRLNTVGTQLAQIPGVHAMTDVTGFGLLGHAWEMARGAQLHIEIDFDQLPWLPQAREFAAQGVVTGASNRNWAAYGEQVHLAEHLDLTQRHLLTDPQTSGGLLLSCAPEAVEQVMETLRTHGFAQAAPIGRVQTGAAAVQVA
ncbi:MAG TPA: selenide, water dikinase SelD [Paenalcaligenes sp.]|nr:selenide, water dikinase SelD [Paenalcaligenes sp.]